MDHTPGPWVAEFNGHYWQVNPANKRPEDPWQIGDVCASEPTVKPSALQEANAKIFAAAPELADALENLIIAIGMGWDLEGVVQVAQEAIAKARGTT